MTGKPPVIVSKPGERVFWSDGPDAHPKPSEGQPAVRWFTGLAVIAACIGVVVLLLPDAQAATTRTPSQLHRDFLCIHRYEGSWTARTGNGYYGGLQMNSSFERTYGREFVRAWGHANRWPAGIQIAVAMRAWADHREKVRPPLTLSLIQQEAA